MRKKPVALDDVELDIGVKPERDKAPVYDHLAGQAPNEGIYNVTGCPVSVQGVLVRTYKADPFTLAIKLGGQWFNLTKIRQDDPGLQAVMDQMIEYGPSPREIEKQRQKEETERQRLEAEEDYKRKRQEANRKIKERAKGQFRRGIAQMFAGR